jgi:hypothetical protein
MALESFAFFFNNTCEYQIKIAVYYWYLIINSGMFMKFIAKLFVTLLITALAGINCAYARGGRWAPPNQGADPNVNSSQYEERGMTSEERNALQNEQQRRTDPEATSSSY